MLSKAPQRLIIHGCPRCRGDLLLDAYEDDFACLQCGRHVAKAQLEAQPKPAPQKLAA